VFLPLKSSHYFKITTFDFFTFELIQLLSVTLDPGSSRNFLWSVLPEDLLLLNKHVL